MRSSLLVTAAAELYHKRDYLGALAYLQRAAGMGAVTAQMGELQVKSLAQLGRIAEARGALRDYRQHGERRQWYLEGFVDRKATEHNQACSKFQRGYRKGDRSTSLLRDYADSLLRIDAIDDAAAMAHEALERAPGNVYILDLVARIEIQTGTREAAEQAVDALEAVDVDKQLCVQRRMPFLIYRRGGADGLRRAIRLGDDAVARRGAALEIYTMLAHALIRAKNWKRVDEVKDEIRRRRHIDKRFVLGRLDLDAAIQSGDWRRAEQLPPAGVQSAEDRDYAAAVYELKAEDRSVLLTERDDAKREAERLRKAMKPEIRRAPMSPDLYE